MNFDDVLNGDLWVLDVWEEADRREWFQGARDGILVPKVEQHGQTLKTKRHKVTLQPSKHAQTIFGGNQHGTDMYHDCNMVTIVSLDCKSRL